MVVGENKDYLTLDDWRTLFNNLNNLQFKDYNKEI